MDDEHFDILSRIGYTGNPLSETVDNRDNLLRWVISLLTISTSNPFAVS